MKKTIYVYSVIPKLSELISTKLPEANVKNVAAKDGTFSDWKNGRPDAEVSQLQDAEIILGDVNLISEVYEKLPNTKWVHCTWAGVEQIVKNVQQGPKPNFPVTRMTSPLFSQLMGEYAIGWILNCERGWLEARQYQLQSIWAKKGKISNHRSLQELTVGVLGVGRIGSEVIQSLKFFKCKVLGLGRSPTPPVGLPLDEYFPASQLSSLLEKCDYVINILPSTADTKGLLGKETFSLARKKPVFINVGRANIISEVEIINALDKSWISAAILDVFETEPLSPSSSLWLHPKVIITPHVSAVSRPTDVVESFFCNLERYLKSKPLQDVVDWDRGY